MLYEREGIEWSFIQFPDNADILELLENRRSGIFALCDEQVRFPKATDLTLVSKIYEHCAGHNRFIAGPKEKANNVFIVKHFAGPVCYSSQQFLEKNHDVVRLDMAQVVKLSLNSLVVKLFDYMRVDDLDIVSIGKSGADKKGLPVPARRGSLTGKISTLSAEFRVQLEELMTKINATSPHYVRCLKPNSRNVGDIFDPNLVIGQLRCGGVLEAVRVSRAGYPNRYTFEQFVARYSLLGEFSAEGAVPKPTNKSSKKLIPKKVAAPQRSLKDTVEMLSAKISDMCWSSTSFIPNADAAHLTDKMQRAGIQRGSTMIFLRSRTFEFLERELQLLKKRAAIKIQKQFRRYSCMTKFQILKRSAVAIQCAVRMHQAVVYVQQRRELRAVNILLKCIRGFFGRLRARLVKRGICRLQAVKRGQRARMEIIDVRLRFRAARVIQCKVRCLLARRRFKEAKTEARSLKAVINQLQYLHLLLNALLFVIDCR